MHVNYRVWKFHSERWKQGLLLCGYGLHGVRTGLTCEETADSTPVSNYQESLQERMACLLDYCPQSVQ